MFDPDDPMIGLLAQAGFRGWCDQSVEDARLSGYVAGLPYWRDRDVSSEFTKLAGLEHFAIALEEAALLYGIVRCFKPRLVIETGCNSGLSSSAIALGLRANRRGHFLTCDVSADWVRVAGKHLASVFDRFAVIHASGVDAIEESKSGRMVSELSARKDGVGIFFHDSDHSKDVALSEFLAVEECIVPGGLAIFHDYWICEGIRLATDEILLDNKWSRIVTPSTPGFAILQKSAT